jgi:hypothetical protein
MLIDIHLKKFCGNDAKGEKERGREETVKKLIREEMVSSIKIKILI